MVSLEFFTDIKYFRSHYVHGVDSASNRNECQEYFLGGKGGRQPYQIHVPIVLKSGSLNLWNPQDFSRPVMGLLYLSIIASYHNDKWAR